MCISRKNIRGQQFTDFQRLEQDVGACFNRTKFANFVTGGNVR